MLKKQSKWSYLLTEETTNKDEGIQVFSMVSKEEKTEYFQLRDDARIKQGVAAEALGIGQSCLSQIESGRRDPDDELKKKMLDYYASFIVGTSAPVDDDDIEEEDTEEEFEANQSVLVRDKDKNPWTPMVFKFIDDNSEFRYVCSDKSNSATKYIGFAQIKKALRQVTMEELTEIVGEDFEIIDEH